MKKGFTFLEMMATMAIISVLVALLVSSIHKALQSDDLKTTKAFYTLTRDVAFSDDILGMDMELKLEEEDPKTEPKETIVINSKSPKSPKPVKDYFNLDDYFDERDNIDYHNYYETDAVLYESLEKALDGVIVTSLYLYLKDTL